MFDVRQCTAIEIWLELEMGKVACVNTIIYGQNPGKKLFLPDNQMIITVTVVFLFLW